MESNTEHREVNVNNLAIKFDDKLIEPTYRGFIMNSSFEKWLDTCPSEYVWMMNEVTKDRGTYTFILKEA